MYSVSLIKLWSQNKKVDFAEVYLESNKRLVPFEGKCSFSGVDPYIKFPTRPNGQRIVVAKIGIEEFVLYRTQGSSGVGFVAQIEKPVTEENKKENVKKPEQRSNLPTDTQSKADKNKKSDKKIEESKSDDKIILQNLTKQFDMPGLTAYKAQGSACSKGTDIDSEYKETIAKRYKSPLSLVRLIRVQESNSGCDAIVDTVHGPIECPVLSVFSKKGSKIWLLSPLWGFESGQIARYQNSCRPHPDVFERR
jgi:hypothetical protein